jgi:serine protease AprX
MFDRLNCLGIALALCLGLLGPTSLPETAGAANLHPLLARLAVEQPDQMVSVIVQKVANNADAEALVAALGGVVTKDLTIINAFAAQLTAAAARELAQHRSVNWVSLDAPVVQSGGPDGTVSTTALLNTYNAAIGADRLWAEGYQGSSVTVAVVDSGIADLNDFKQSYGGNGGLRIQTTVSIVGGSDFGKDWYGHGTHVAGVIGGNGTLSYGRYIGVAPKVKLIAVDVTNEQGAGTTSDVIAGLQWIYNNRAAHNIRVVNISLNSSVAESYHTSALDAAVEILWFSGIVVVVSGGNNGSSSPGILYPPANDPFVISVGAVDDRGTVSTSDDGLASFSAYGIAQGGFVKPDLVAPGKDIYSLLSKADSSLAVAHPGHRHPDPSFRDYYMRMSGTSMAAPMVAGAVALLLQDEPNLTPDQVKYRLMATARPFSGGSGAKYLDAYAAVHGTTTQSANTGRVASQLLWTGSSPVTWGSVNWNSVNWNSVNWNSVNWNSVNWNSVNWNNDYWGP